VVLVCCGSANHRRHNFDGVDVNKPVVVDGSRMTDDDINSLIVGLSLMAIGFLLFVVVLYLMDTVGTV
jgi:hypothetical protein